MNAPQNDPSRLVLCPRCRAQNAYGAAVCTTCGASLAGGTVLEAKPVEQMPKQPRPILRWIMYGVGGLVGLCIICAILGALVPDTPSTTQSSPTRTVNVADNGGESTTAQTTNTPTNVVIETVVAADNESSVSPSPQSFPSPTLASDPVSTPNPTNTVEPTLEPTKEILPKIGDQVDVGEISWRVEDAVEAGDTIASDNQFVEPLVTAGKFVRVRVALQNQGSEQRSVSAGGLEIIDDQGRSYKASTDFKVSMIVGSDNACVFQELPAGVPKLCRLVFEVPQDAKGFKFKATNLALIFTDEKLVELGF